MYKRTILNNNSDMNKTNKKDKDPSVVDNKFLALCESSDNEEQINSVVENTENTEKNTFKEVIPKKKGKHYNKSLPDITIKNNPEEQYIPKIISENNGFRNVNYEKNKHTKYENREHRDNRDNRNYRDKNKPLYDGSLESNPDLGNNMYFSSSWTVWSHRVDCQSWTKDSYIKVYTIDNIGSFWRFFNNMHLLNKFDNQFFIMRDQIYPIWEDNNNRNGGIYSIKIDCFANTPKYKADIGSEMMTCLCLLAMNDTLIQQNEEINGISFSIKNKNSTLIKIWYKDYNYNIKSVLPTNLFGKLEEILKHMNKSNYGKKMENRVTKQIRAIKPEYEME